MKPIFKIFVTLSAVIANSAFAYNLNKVEVYPPHINVGCSRPGIDTVGALGITLNGLMTTESESSINISLVQTLKVCRLSLEESGKKSLAWEVSNPYAGLRVQYYDHNSNSLKDRIDVIDHNSKINRFEAIIYSEERKFANKSILTANQNKSNNATFEIKKLDLVDQNDIDAIEAGNDIKKTLILFNVLNTTTFIDGKPTLYGDQHFSGRNVTLTLTKSKNQIKVKKIEIK